MSSVLAHEREIWLSRRSVTSLGVCSEQWAAEKQNIQLAAADSSSVNHLQNSVSKHLSLTEWTFKYEHN